MSCIFCEKETLAKIEDFTTINYRGFTRKIPVLVTECTSCGTLYLARDEVIRITPIKEKFYRAVEVYWRFYVTNKNDYCRKNLQSGKLRVYSFRDFSRIRPYGYYRGRNERG